MEAVFIFDPTNPYGLGGYNVTNPPTDFNANGYSPSTGENSGNLNFQSPQETLNGQNYYAPVAYNPASDGGPNAPGWITPGSGYNPVTNPNDFTYDSIYVAPQGPVALAPTQTNDPYAGLTFAQAESYGMTYAQMALHGVGTLNLNYNPDAVYNAANNTSTVTTGGTPYAPGSQYYGQDTPIDTTIIQGNATEQYIPYTPTTAPNYVAPVAAPGGPTGTQTYNSQGQPVAASTPSETQAGMGTPEVFEYGDNGSLGTLAGVSTNNTPGQSTTFYATPGAGNTGIFSDMNTPVQTQDQSGLGSFGSIAPATASTQNDMSNTGIGYGSNYAQIQANALQNSQTGGVNGATGAIGGYNPLGIGQTSSNSQTGTDSALGFFSDVNPITGSQSNNNPYNPALQALQTSRSQNAPSYFS